MEDAILVPVVVIAGVRVEAEGEAGVEDLAFVGLEWGGGRSSGAFPGETKHFSARIWGVARQEEAGEAGGRAEAYDRRVQFAEGEVGARLPVEADVIALEGRVGRLLLPEHGR